MAAARRRVELSLSPQAENEDIPEIPDELLPFMFAALDEIQARRDEAMDPKQKRLAGTFSAAFLGDPEEDKETASGRIVYLVEGRDIVVLALHQNHDEAYRRARTRYRPVKK